MVCRAVFLRTVCVCVTPNLGAVGGRSVRHAAYYVTSNRDLPPQIAAGLLHATGPTTPPHNMHSSLVCVALIAAV
eukprot:1646944-Prymnesium_polylepis.2